MFKFLFITIVLGQTVAHNSPVLLWGADCASRPSLTTLKQNEFFDLIRPLLKGYTIVVFLEANLTNKDFLCLQPGTEETCYAHLKYVSPKTYYAKVQSPLEALQSIASVYIANSVNELGELLYPIACKLGEVHMMTFNNSEHTWSHADNQRSRRLAAHDSIIASVSQNLHCPVVYLYMAAELSDADTSITKPRRRIRRQSAALAGGSLFRLSNFIIFYSDMSLKPLAEGSSHFISTISNIKVFKTYFQITLQTSQDVSLNFAVLRSGGYYTIKSFTYDNVTYYVRNVETPKAFAYYCGSLTGRSSLTKAQLVFSHIQFQGFDEALTQSEMENFKFAETWSCNGHGFVTTGIMMGLFVSAILVAITSCAICWIMDIKTNDRFEDPTGIPFKAALEDTI